MSLGISDIGWTELTWNWLVGCRPKSRGCLNCYAGILASTRLRHLPMYEGVAEDGVFTGLVRVKKPLIHEPLSRRKGRMIFVNSMSDLFQPQVPLDDLAESFAVMALCPQHRFQGLTKCHDVMRSRLNNPEFRAEVDERARRLISEDKRARRASSVLVDGRVPWPLPNLWLGVSVEDQERALLRIPALLDTPAVVRFLSCEPLIGAVDVTEWLHESVCPIKTEQVCTCGSDVVQEARVDWVIAGGESGDSQVARMDLDWVRSLRDQCRPAGVAFFFKQLGSVLAREQGIRGSGHHLEDFPPDLRIQEYPHAA